MVKPCHKIFSRSNIFMSEEAIQQPERTYKPLVVISPKSKLQEKVEQIKEEPRNLPESEAIIETEPKVFESVSKVILCACGKKALKKKSKCRACLNKDEEEEHIKQEQADYEKNFDPTVSSMFAFHVSSYIVLEQVAAIFKYDLSGLPQKLIQDRDQLRIIYEKIYEEYGPDAINQLMNPVLMLGAISAGHIVSTLQETSQKKD